jgi:hypothetical protein
MKTITNHQIRVYIGKRDGVERVKITRSGEVHCFGSMPRGDGGRRDWWMFVGMVKDLRRELEVQQEGYA